MGAIVYKPADVLHWFETDVRRSSLEARARGREAARKAGEEGLVSSLREAAGAGLSFGRGAVGGIVQRQAEETRYELHETGFECVDLTRRVRVDYGSVRQILARPNDRYEVLYNGGRVTVKPVAHLVSGRFRVPVGWTRNGTEVAYAMLIEELSARSGVEIEAE